MKQPQQTMSEAAIQARREYNRKWAQDHKEQCAASRAAYWERKAESMRQKSAETGNEGSVIMK